jgi:hypothetical protein
MRWIWSAAMVVVVLSGVASAQPGETMKKAETADKMPSTFTGCVEAVNHGGSFLLTGMGDGATMMHHQGSMASEPAKQDKAGAASEMPADHMMPTAVFLAGRHDLTKHVGQKVTVTGSLSHDMSETTPNNKVTLTIASLKVVAKSCS